MKIKEKQINTYVYFADVRLFKLIYRPIIVNRNICINFMNKCTIPTILMLPEIRMGITIQKTLKDL